MNEQPQTNNPQPQPASAGVPATGTQTAGEAIHARDQQANYGASANRPEPQQPPAPSKAADDVLLDLDELVPTKKRVRLQGQIIEVEQPSTEQLMELVRVGKKLEGMQTGQYDLEVLEKTLEKVTEIARSLAPALAGYQLNLMQALALISMLQDMAMPSKLQELQKRGVTPAEIPKGAAS